MARHIKRFRRLDDAETELRALLVKHLREVATGDDTLFFVTAFNNPWPELRSGSAAGTELLARAHYIIDMAAKLGAVTDDLVAAKVIAYFGGANDLTDHHRLGPIRLARKLLHELGENIPSGGRGPTPH